jgi:hypothetical protein
MTEGGFLMNHNQHEDERANGRMKISDQRGWLVMVEDEHFKV